MPVTLEDQLDGQTKTALKSVEEAQELSVQKRATATAMAMPGVWWFSRPEQVWDVAPWWSPQRDSDLRVFVKEPGNDILQGAISSMVKRFKAMNWTLDGPKATVEDRQEVLSEAEFGAGWGILLSKTIEDFLTVDRGAFWELIGKGDPDKPMDGLPVGVAHLDALRCHLTGDPDFPVVFMNAKDGRARKLHATRVVHMVDMESPNEDMCGIGFSATSRVIASSQILMMLSQYKREKLDDLPQAGLLVLNNIVPSKWEDTKAEYERERRKLNNQIWANIMTLIGVDPAQPADAKFLSFAQIPEHFDEQQSITTYVNIVALAMGIDSRELWPDTGGSAALGTATESQIMHLKARGKGIGDLISTIERVVNWRLMPKRVVFKFDNVDSEEDQSKAELEKTKIDSIMSMWKPDPMADTPVSALEIRQMLADNVDYFLPDFLEVDLTGDVVASDVDRDTDN